MRLKPLKTSARRLQAAGLLSAAMAIGACTHTPQGVAPAAPAAPAQSAPSASGSANSILWVGNSFFYYNNSMHGHYGLLAASAGDRVRGTSVTISGSGIDWHDVASLLRPNGLGRYSFVGDNEVRFNPPGRQYDAVMMMDCSQCPIHPQLRQTFYDTAKAHAATVRAYGAQPVLFMSWAYKDKPEMTQQLAAEYTAAGKANNAVVVPAGLAFARAIAMKPDIELYVADKRHPSLEGTYVAACTVYATLMGKSPVGLSYTAGLKPEVARLLQQAAWDAVAAYKSQR